MQVFDAIKKTEYNTAVALGFFDGVHKGHKAVINKCKAAKKPDERLTVFTFKDSPNNVLSKTKKQLLSTNADKFTLLEELGVEIVFCVDFCEVKDLLAESFVEDILRDKLNAKTVATGFNYHFGKGGKSSCTDLKVLCEKLSIKTHICEPVIYNNEAVSSTRIRECIKNGDMENANNMLGYNFFINTEVTSGNHIGTKISTPTINQLLSESIVTPKFGVYATKVTIGKNHYFGATNIGTHPTVGDCSPVCETHLLNFSKDDLYGKNAVTELLHFIRPEKKFHNITELKNQIEKDKSDILNYLNI